MPNHPFVPLSLLADAGIPMIFLTWPAMVVLLVPVIIIEGLLCKKWLGLTAWQAIRSNAVSNLASTLVGIPAAWTVMLAVEFGGLGAFSLFEKVTSNQKWGDSPLADVILMLMGSAWIGPVEGRDQWVIPAATLVLLVPFFFASYWVEYFVVRRMVIGPDEEKSDLTRPSVRTAVRDANLVTYGIMFFGVVWLVILLAHR